MQTVKTATPLKMRKRIGSTVYVTNVYFKNDAAETMNDKILRLIKNDLKFGSKNDNIKVLQMGGLPERGSL